jgi:hypothetical protein
MKRTLAVTSAVFLFATLAFAHGNEQHVIGTITAINGDVITIQTVDKQTKVVNLSGNTKFTKSGAAASRDDLKVGDRVVIHAQKEGDKLVAHSVALGRASLNAPHKHTEANTDHKQ